jgi:predicted RND superfamily exporter protein
VRRFNGGVPLLQNGGCVLIPNLLPLMITAGLMGYFGIPKTIHNIGFSIAFGLSVDDTIHFLAQYRQELTRNNWKIKRSVLPL